MNRAAWRGIIRLTAVLVLLNVALGLCACLGDTPVLSAKGAVVLTTHPEGPQPSSECGDDCDSCVCCASLLVARRIRLETVLTLTRAAVVTTDTHPSDPELQALKRPPRA